MKEIYQEPSVAASFGATEDRISMKRIQNCLSGIDSYSLYKLVKRNFPTNRIFDRSPVANRPHGPRSGENIW